MKQPSIILTGGGSLGPVTPLLAVSEALKTLSPNATVSWIGTEAGPERRLVNEAGLPFFAIASGKLRRYFAWRNLTDVWQIVRGFFQAFALLGRLKADAVVSAGGFVAVPVVWAAWWRRIPVHIHQQDVLAGLANKLSLPVASSVSVALETSLRDFRRKHPTWTGNPVRAELLAGSRERAVSSFAIDTSKPTVLVLGGGTGASGLNDALRAALPAILPHAQVIHSTGLGKSDRSADVPGYHQFELITVDMQHAFAAADLVVTRAGMGTLTELALLGKPSVIVPMPKSHQLNNAAAFADAAIVVDQSRLTPDFFSSVVIALLQDAEKRTALSQAMRKMNPPGADVAIAKVVLAEAERHAGN